MENKDNIMYLKEYKLNYTLSTIPKNLDVKDKIIYDLLHEGFNDSNSSKFREDATNFISGREASEGKHGYDVDDENIEIKPKNFIGKGKNNGGGQFTDFTWKRHNKYQEDNVIMSVSGFDHGKLLFVLEFDYINLKDRIEEQLSRLLPNGDVPNRYVRSASFNFKHYSNSDIKKVYVSPNIKNHKHAIVGKLFEFLTK